jgi:hypothetical protein
MAVRGYGFYSYLSTYPILGFTDLIAPLAFIAMAKAVYSEGNNK